MWCLYHDFAATGKTNHDSISSSAKVVKEWYEREFNACVKSGFRELIKSTNWSAKY